MKNIKMRYSIKPIDMNICERNGFLSFAKNMGKNLSNKYGQKNFNSSKNLQQTQ